MLKPGKRRTKEVNKMTMGFSVEGIELWRSDNPGRPFAQVDRGYGPKLAATLNLGLAIEPLATLTSELMWSNPITARWNLAERMEDFPVPDPTLSFGANTTFRADGRGVLKEFLPRRGGPLLVAGVIATDHIGKAQELLQLLRAGLQYERGYQGLLLYEEAIRLMSLAARTPESELMPAPGCI